MLDLPWGIYARVSTEEQASEGLSLDAQLSQLRDYFAQRRIAVQQYVDAGKSAWTENLDRRPAFKSMMDDIRAGEIGGVGVTHLDRFSRKLIVTLKALGELGERGAGFVSLENSSFDFSKPADRLLLVVLGAFAEYYSAELSRKIRRGLLKRAASGLHVGTVPFGYCNGKCPGCSPECERFGKVEKESPPIVHVGDAPGVPLAFDTYRLGTHSDRTIANVLNAAGFRSRTAGGREQWNKHSVSWLLTNLFYTGAVAMNGKEFEGKHHPLIAREVFDEVQAIRLQHQHASSVHKARHRVYLFAGILVCSGCGRKMRATAYGGRANDFRGYRCTAIESKKVVCRKPQRPFRADRLEEEFGEIVKQLRLPADWRERVNQMLDQKGKHKNVENERKRIRERLERIKWLYAQGDLSEREYARERDDLKGQLAGMKSPQEREVLDAGALLENLAAIWEEATIVERREMVLTLITRIECDPETKRIVSLQPRPAFVTLFLQIRMLKERDGLFVPSQLGRRR